jgi:hypothetical protein
MESIKAYGREVTALLQNYVRPILFGDPPARIVTNEPLLRGATVTFVKSSKRIFGITNHHVVQAFRKLRLKDPQAHCQLDSLSLDIEQRLLDQNEKLDLATIDITEAEITKMGAIAYSPSKWQHDTPVTGELAAIVGYPGRLRFFDPPKEVNVVYVGLILPITSISSTNITFQFQRQYWKTHVGQVEPSQLDDFGGISGSGVFAMRIAPVLVGIVYEYGPNFDLLVCSKTDCITEDGKINSLVY